MAPTADIVAAVPYGEGTVWCTNGTLVACNTGGGQLWRVLRWRTCPRPGRPVHVWPVVDVVR